MQDDYNRFIRRSMKQAQCNYEDIFAEIDAADTDVNPSRGDMGTTVGTAATNSGGAETAPVCDTLVPVMAFVETQPFGSVYNEAEALCRGTLFPALDKPFTGRGGHC